MTTILFICIFVFISRSQEWQFIPESEREEMGLNFAHDGEFWMSFSDFTKNFQKLEIVHLGPEVSEQKVSWSSTQTDGGWKRRVNAGGCRNFLGSTLTPNPKHSVLYSSEVLIYFRHVLDEPAVPCDGH